jgi:hypothetical protein
MINETIYVQKSIQAAGHDLLVFSISKRSKRQSTRAQNIFNELQIIKNL